MTPLALKIISQNRNTGRIRSADKNRFINRQNTPESVYVFKLEDIITGLEDYLK